MLLLLLIITRLIVLVTAIRANLLEFSVEEKSPVNTLVVELSKFINHSSSSSSYSFFEITPLSTPLFSLDKRTGRLTTSTVINREELCARQDCACGNNGINGPCQIGLELIVNTPMMMTNYETIQIKILDRNDHAPVFAEQATMHTIQIKENVPLGYRIVLPSASDPDEGLNAVQSYSLSGGNAEDFDVDFSSIDTPYLIVRSSLDRRRVSSYSLTLTASDQGQQPTPRSGSTRLDIRILAVNDSVPSFVQSVYSIDVREDVQPGTFLLQIEAKTIDQHVTYQLVNDSPFVIDRNTGQLRLQKSLDYETIKSYRLTVRARDETTGSMPAYATVLVRVLDVNDNPVTIRIKVEGNTTLKQTRTNQSVFFVPEDTLVGTTLAHVILNDLDSFANGNPYLQLTSNQPPLPFIYKLIYQNNVKNTKLFALILQQKLDRETVSMYDNIELIAHDSGTPALLTRRRLALNVIDVNDCTPIFRLNSTIFDVDENNPVGLIVGTLIASDCDLGTNALVEYRLMNETDLIMINQQTGQISVSRSIDFEQLGDRRKKNSTIVDLEFQVQVIDHGQPPLSSETRIILRIHDLNDNSPRFDSTVSYNWTVAKSALEPNAVLGRVKAIDADCGMQGIVHYSIRSLDPCLKLAITSLGFVYSVSSSIACPTISYEFEVTASDFGTPTPRSSTQSLTILINTDMNTPRFPHLVSSSMQRTVVDVNTIGSVAFVLDLSTIPPSHNLTYLPSVHLNNRDLSSCWNVTSSGEILLKARPFASSYILSLDINDEFTQKMSTSKLQIDLCNSSIAHSCTQLRAFSSLNDSNQNRVLLTWAIGLALAITCSCILIFSIITCLCCRKREKNVGMTTSSVSSNHHPHSFLQCSDDFGSEKTESSSDRFKSSSGSTIRDDDHDSACIINGNSSSVSSSGGIPHQYYGLPPGRRESTVRMYSSSGTPPPPPSSAYFYDLKLAELLRTGQHPPCVHLSELPPPSQSLSTDCGFGSSERSGGSSCSSASIIPPYQQKFSRPSANTSEWSIEMGVDASPLRPPNNASSFISSHECVV